MDELKADDFTADVFTQRRQHPSINSEAINATTRPAGDPVELKRISDTHPPIQARHLGYPTLARDQLAPTWQLRNRITKYGNRSRTPLTGSNHQFSERIGEGGGGKGGGTRGETNAYLSPAARQALDSKVRRTWAHTRRGPRRAELSARRRQEA